MVNRNKVNQILKDVEKYLKELESLLPVTLDNLKKNLERRYSIAFLLEQIVNECINLGNHVISSKDLETPSSFKEIFDILGKANMISKKTAENMKFFVEVRNIIAHRYGRFSNEDLIKAVEGKEKIKKYIEELIKSIG